MKILIGYATREGQSKKIARFVSDTAIDLGHSVELLPLSAGDTLDPVRFNRAILVAPIHVGHFPKALVSFVAANKQGLDRTETLFLSVSLAAAGHDAEDWHGLDKIIKTFTEATGWQPNKVAHIAGAYKPTAYDIVTRFMMRRIVSKKDPDAKPGEDKEYTDWTALATLVADWTGAEVAETTGSEGGNLDCGARSTKPR